MKSKLIIFGFGFVSAVLLGLLIFLFANKPQRLNTPIASAKKIERYDPEIDGFVPNEETAIKIAEAIWLSVFKEEDVVDYKPYKAELKDDTIWVVRGTRPFLLPGTLPYIEIQKRDCKILIVWHGLPPGR